MSALERLAALLHADGGLLAQARAPAAGAPGPAQLACRGPRAAARADDYELLVEAIYEGYLLHYRTPRLLSVPDRDLALLAGDHLYARGLALLVEIGDIDAVQELADVIALSAQAHAAGDAELAAAVWSGGAEAVGWGSSPEHREAKQLARAGAPGARSALGAVAQRHR